MIKSSNHRVSSSHITSPSKIDNQPLYSQLLIDDTSKQLQALEKLEREEETKARRERVERISIEREQSQLLASQQQQLQITNNDEDDQKKKKRRKDTTNVKNMSDDVQKKLSDQTALRSAGLAPKYSWLTGGNQPVNKGNLNKQQNKPANQLSSNLSLKSSQQKSLGPPPHDAHLKKSSININDALFALEREKGLGAGRGSGQTSAWKRYITSNLD